MGLEISDDIHEGMSKHARTMEDKPRYAEFMGNAACPWVEDVRDDAVRAVVFGELHERGLEQVDGGDELWGDAGI